MATKGGKEIVIELEGFSLSDNQVKAIANAVRGVVVQGLSTDKDDAVLVRPPRVSAGGIRIGVARVLGGGKM